jgi:hypothetical protein
LDRFSRSLYANFAAAMSDDEETDRRRVTQSRSTAVVVLTICCLLSATMPSVAARTMVLGSHQPQYGIATTRPPLRQGHQHQSTGLNHRISRSSPASNRHELLSPAHHPSASSPLLTMSDVQQYVDDQVVKLEARFTHRLDEQSRKLNQTIAIQYIEKVRGFLFRCCHDARHIRLQISDIGGLIIALCRP